MRLKIYLQLVGYSNLEKASAMNMVLLIPSIAAFFLYRRLMGQSERMMPGGRGRQERLDLSMRKCGLAGHLVNLASILFFVMMALQYGCILSVRFLKNHEGRVFVYDPVSETDGGAGSQYHGTQCGLSGADCVLCRNAVCYAVCLLYGAAKGSGKECL